MGIFDIFFKQKNITERCEPEHSELYKKVVYLLFNDIHNWKEGICDTYVHQPTGIGLSTTGESAFVYVDCNSINARSGKNVELEYPESADLYCKLVSTLHAEKGKKKEGKP